MEGRRYLSIWFRHLVTDRYIRRHPVSKDDAFIFCTREKNREVVTYVSALASASGIRPSMVLSDARLLLPCLQVIPGNPDPKQILHQIALRCIRYSPVVAVDPPDGVLIEITGCAHLWGGEVSYYKDIVGRILAGGYDVRAAIADTPGAAWAFARYLKRPVIVPAGDSEIFLPQLSPSALRLSPAILDRLRSLGMSRIMHILDQPRTTLTPRFGKELLQRLDQALGLTEEWLVPVVPPAPFRERLPCMEPVVTASGIEYALMKLLEMLCSRLRREEKGLRTALFQCLRVDGKILGLSIGTTRASCSIAHLFKLFETKIPEIEPGMGIELFIIEAPNVEDAGPGQEALWGGPGGVELAELFDRIAAKTGEDAHIRFFPAEHHWPERSYRRVSTEQRLSKEEWPAEPRPIHLYEPPEAITVTAPIPDYPPMNFRHRGGLYKVVAASGPTRLENEWWIDDARPRDYYIVEDEKGARYWIFRAGHYDDPESTRWFLHGLFA